MTPEFADTPERTAILDNADVDALLGMPGAIAVVRQALKAKAAGTWVAPPRHHVAFPGMGELVFTVGGALGASGVAGFRVYDTFGRREAEHTQIVAAWDPATARLLGLVLGKRLGELRTGAIGGLAVDLMARPDAAIVAVVGSGAQARTQLEGAAAVRAIGEVRRSAVRREAFAAEMSERLGLSVQPVADAEETVRGADIVLLATSSRSPVIEARWLSAGAHVNTVGPKTVGRGELSVDAAERAAVIATDSPAQARAYGAPFFLEGSPAMARMVDLAAIAADPLSGRPSPNAITLFCSVGLAGTEVLIAAEILRRNTRRTPARVDV